MITKEKKNEGVGLQASWDGHLPCRIDQGVPDDGRTKFVSSEVVVDRVKYEEEHEAKDQKEQRANVEDSTEIHPRGRAQPRVLRIMQKIVCFRLVGIFEIRIKSIRDECAVFERPIRIL